MDRDRILKVLREDLTAAQKQCHDASGRFGEIIREVRTPEGQAHIRDASHEYTRTHQEALIAFLKLNNFLTHGTIPPGLGRKTAAKKNAKLDREKHDP